MSHCPIRRAAIEAPNELAIISKEGNLTFKELDALIDYPKGNFFIASFFKALRCHGSIFPKNPKVPNLPDATHPNSVLLLTSGSTGTPKIAILPFDALLANAESAIGPLGLKQGDRWRLSLPLYHVGGIAILLRCAIAKAAVVLDDDPLITHLSYVPTQLYRATPLYKNLRCLLLGGAPIDRVPKDLPIFTSYGLTEMGSIVALNGKVLPNREVCIKDGEIFVKGSCLFQGYLGEPLQEGFFATRDLGRFIDGKLEIIGRKDWMFISGGENIQPEEIEKYLLSMDGVEEAVVVGLDDAEYGKRPVAIVQSQKRFSFSDMQRHLRQFLPTYKIPIELHFWKEIPKKSNFKINRFIISQSINNK
jgi:o-succinylbenzoate---CoA ligase